MACLLQVLKRFLRQVLDLSRDKSAAPHSGQFENNNTDAKMIRFRWLRTKKKKNRSKKRTIQNTFHFLYFLSLHTIQTKTMTSNYHAYLSGRMTS